MLVCLFGTARASIRAADTLLAALFCLIDIESGGCNNYHKNANYDILKDAPIVILDEATANVDPENEDRLQKAIEALTRNKTILMIAHRLKTVRNADQILVLDGGQIVQRGTHSQLMAQGGLYQAFVSGRKESGQWKL